MHSGNYARNDHYSSSIEQILILEIDHIEIGVAFHEARLVLKWYIWYHVGTDYKNY